MQGLQGQELYLTGGNDGVSWLDAVEVYTPSRNQWVTAQPMPLERGYGAAAAIGRQMFVMGGGNGSSWLQSVMMCNLESSTWLEVSVELPMVGKGRPDWSRCLQKVYGGSRCIYASWSHMQSLHIT